MSGVRFPAAALGAATTVATMLVGAAPASADVGFPPGWVFELLWLVPVGIVVLIIAGFSLRFLHKAARERRLDKEAAEKWAKLKAQEQEETR
jgi:hypothetical protein